MDLSVVVCTHNRAASLRLTLEALEAQVVPPTLGWELIVVDNNSTDATRSVVTAFAAEARAPLRYRFEPRQGLSNARNAGIVEARGGIVAFTDDDVLPDRAWVATIAIAMRESSADVLGGRILPLWTQPAPRWLETRSLLRAHLAILEFDRPASIVTSSGIPSVWGANMALRRRVFDRVGLFDVNRGNRGAKLYRGDDTELVRRAIAAGLRAVYDPRVLVWHRIGAERMRVRYFSRLFFERSEGMALVLAPPQGRLVLGVPPVAYRRTARRFQTWLRALAVRRPEALDRWLEFCEALGLLWGLWKRYYRRMDATKGRNSAQGRRMSFRAAGRGLRERFWVSWRR